MVPTTHRRLSPVRAISVLAALLLAASASATSSDGHEISDASPQHLDLINEAIVSVPDDFRSLFRFPIEHWSETRAGLLAVGALVLLDKPLTKAWQDHVEPSLDGFRLPKSPVNSFLHGVSAEDGWLITGVGLTTLWGLTASDTKAAETGILATKAAVYSVVTSQLLFKSLFGRRRPVDSLSTQSLRFFQVGSLH